jgi:hypothetical protein
LKASNATSSRKARPGALPGSADSSSSTAEPQRTQRFTLSGPSAPLDERIHAYRRDIADIALAGQIIAPHYARATMRVASTLASAVRTAPLPEAEIAADLRPGDEFAVLDMAGGWAWGYRRLDHRVGYVPLDHLVD